MAYFQLALLVRHRVAGERVVELHASAPDAIAWMPRATLTRIPAAGSDSAGHGGRR